MVDSDTISFTVTNIFGPGTAFNMQKLILRCLCKLNSNNWTLVVNLITILSYFSHVWEKLCWESLRCGKVFDILQVLPVSWVFTMTFNPDLFLIFLSFDMFFQRLWHLTTGFFLKVCSGTMFICITKDFV